MRLKPFIICIFLAPVSLSAQVILDTMYFDGDWEPSPADKAHYYRIISTDTSAQFRFIVRDYYLTGQVQMSGTYRSIRPDNKDGHFIYYYENGQIQTDCYYENNQRNGPYEEWYESGQQKISQVYSNDVLDGPFSSWRENGTYKLQAHYTQGEKNGYFISYYENGQKLRNDLYENDRLVEGQCYTPEGEPTDYFPYIKMPQFPEGRTAMRDFIRNELHYPSETRRRFRPVEVIVGFTVDEEGSIQDPSILEGDASAFNDEALRITREMPRWIPGEVDGVPSPIQVTLPIEFSRP